MATYETIDPTTGAVIESHPVMTAEEGAAAIERAHAGFESWRRVPIEERADVVRNIAKLLVERGQQIADQQRIEMGRSAPAGLWETSWVASIATYEADHGPSQLADDERETAGGRALITHRPMGVILGIQPWNFPTYQAARFSLANLVAGNSVVLKHAPNVWGTAKMLIELYHDAGVPQDVMVGLFTDNETTEALIGHRLVRGVSFTGSDVGGAAVAAAAGRHRKKSVLELGSNDAYIVLSDADVARAVRICTSARMINNGQACIAAKRFIVTADVYDEFREGVLAQMGGMVMGDPAQEDTTLGPVAREDLRDKLHAQVVASVEAGATLLMGGEVPERPGWFYPATVLEDVAPGMPAYDDELFGPVATLIRVADDAEAMRVANDSRFGLGGGIFSADVERAVALARDEFDTGMVNINSFGGPTADLPFGGTKDSGYGREHGGYGILEFVNTKTIVVPS